MRVMFPNQFLTRYKLLLNIDNNIISMTRTRYQTLDLDLSKSKTAPGSKKVAPASKSELDFIEL